MPNQKLENVLNLALATPENERQKSNILNVGFEENLKRWELIVKYNGNITQLASDIITVEELINGYAIVTLPEAYINSFSALEEVEYIEKPKRLYFEMEKAVETSCIYPVKLRAPNLSGKGCIVAVIDSGINPFLSDFRNADGSTRILEMWDQEAVPDSEKNLNPPEGFATGVALNQAEINQMLAEYEKTQTGYVGQDFTGHGTAVAAIAAGSNPENEGVASGADIVVVKLGRPEPDSFPRTTELMRALTYVARLAQKYNRPVAINLSFGNTYGSHSGTSLVERFLDNISEIGRSVICVGSGNEGASAGHVAGRIDDGNIGRVELAVGDLETTVNVQLWKNYTDRYRITLISPGGERYRVAQSGIGNTEVVAGETKILIYVGEPTPYSVNQEIFFDFIPLENYITPGIWTFELEPVVLVMGQFYLYLPSGVARSGNTRFFAPTPQVTLTIPSTSMKVITVGAYDMVYDSYADFSGRGYRIESSGGAVLESDLVKPDLVAPGVGIRVPSIYGEYEIVNGTSFATPFVTGSAALLMEWGITLGNDPYLYGEKVKAYLRSGARELRGEENYPNDRVGFGALCLERSLPE